MRDIFILGSLRFSVIRKFVALWRRAEPLRCMACGPVSFGHNPLLQHFVSEGHNMLCPYAVGHTAKGFSPSRPESGIHNFVITRIPAHSHSRLLNRALYVLIPLFVSALPTHAAETVEGTVLTLNPQPGRPPAGKDTTLNLNLPQPSTIHRLRFVVVDPKTHLPVAGAAVTIEDKSGTHSAKWLLTGVFTPAPTMTFDVGTWNLAEQGGAADTAVVTIVAGTSVTLRARTQAAGAQTQTTTAAGTPAQTAAPAAGQAQTGVPAQVGAQPQPPIRDITIVVRATLLRREQPTPSVTVNANQIKEKTGAGSSPNKLIEGLPSVTSDSAGQEHVRGEHAEIAYVVDGVQLPDTLSGRQGSIVVPSTIQSLSFLTGAYAPEFGGQTAAILDITTLPGARKPHADVEFDGGNYDTTNGNLTWEGPLGKRASYVFNVGATRSRNAVEPQQPDNQTAHNAGSDQSYFGKFRYAPSSKDTLTLTLSNNPSTLQINNRTGLPDSFAPAGEGFGFLGLRNRDGTRPDVITDAANPNFNGNLLGAQTLAIPSQQSALQDITQRELNEFAILNYTRRLSSRDTAQIAVTILHSGQDVNNHNPLLDVLNLPVDNSIEYNPTAKRNAHHVQLTGAVTLDRTAHRFKAGFLLDDQYGNESYNLIPGSRLALDELAALAPNLAPAGGFTPQLDANGVAMKDNQGNPIYVKDVNGNPIYAPTSATSPTLNVHRAGWYRAAYAQDTWKTSRRFTINYGLRMDWYRQSQTLGQPVIDTISLSPRINLSYTLDGLTSLRLSYNRLFNTPPLAQGAVVGQPIEPETLDQYDISVQRQLAPNQTLTLAYYIKDIRNQVDTGLLIPGSQIGLYSALNFQNGGVHGIEFSYDLVPGLGKDRKPRSGIDTNLNYTYSIAAPSGVDNTGALVPTFNDHDQRNTLGFGLGYHWRNGALIGMELQHGSGLASSIVPPSALRTPRTQVNLHAGFGAQTFHNRGGLNLDVENLFDDRTVINFQSGFSGTRFQQGRRVLLSLSGSF